MRYGVINDGGLPVATPWWRLSVAFRQLSNNQLKTITQKLDSIRKKKDKLPVFLCKKCGHPITFEKEIISIAGQHRHVFKNPAGIIYEIGCFAKAAGCMNLGEPTMEFTWFQGYSWRYSVCSQCYTHLGWFYQLGDSRFFGLILERLTRQ